MSDSTDIPEGYKATELGALPDEWNVVKIIDVVDFTKKPRSLSINPDQILPFIPMEMIPENNDSVNRWQEKKNSEISSGTFVFKGDLIVAKITPCFENGKQAILDNLPTDYTYTTTEVWPMHPKENQISIGFLSNYLRHPIIRKELTTKMEGSTNRQRLPRAALQNLIIPLPPLPEQHAIATTLRTVQEAKEKTEAVIAATKALKAAMMKHLFTYGPVPPEEAERVALKETEIGQVPEDWEVIRIGDVIQKTQYGLSIRGEQSGQYPILRMNNLGNGLIDTTDLQYVNLDNDNLQNFRLNYGDILFNRTNSYELVGKTSLFILDELFVFASYIVRIIPNFDKISPEYLNSYLNWGETQSRLKLLASRGVSQSNINATKLRDFSIPFPSLSIQKQIATILTSIDQKLAAEQSRKEALETIFASLLHDLMTAKIRVNTIAV